MLGLVSSTLAQTAKVAVQGKLIGSTSKAPVDFANVLLLSPQDSTLITGAVSDAAGAFQLTAPSGSYILSIKALGHSPYTRALTIPSSPTLDLQTIALSEESVQLSTVTVSAKRPIITRKADRLVFDAEQINLGAQNALDVLKQTPGLSVSDDGVSIIGKGNVIVLINDKRVRLSGKALVNLLRSYTDKDLGQVEIITTPPSKYEAEGNAGILNLVMKKPKNDYFGGSASLEFQTLKGHWSKSGSANLNYKRGKTTASLTASYSNWNFANDFATEKTFPSTDTYTVSKTDFSTNGKFPNLRASLDYDLRPDLTIGGSFTYNRERGTLLRDNLTQDYTMSPSLQLRRYAPGNDEETVNELYLTANIHLEKTFAKTPGKKISWDVDYVGTKGNGDDVFRSQTFTPQNILIPGSDFVYRSENHKKGDAYLTSIDFALPMGSVQTTFGVKGTWSRSEHRQHYLEHTAPQLNGYRTDMTFDEHVYALYADAALPLSAQWNARGGVRLEYTHNDGVQNGTNRLHLRDYLNVFPTIYLGFTPSERHAFSLDGTVRLDRPGFFQLSPFPRYENQYSIMRGREDLRPSKQGSLSLGYTLAGKLNFSAFGQYRWDGLTQYPHLDPATNRSEYVWGNYETRFAYGISNNYYLTSLSFLQLYLNHSAQYTESRIREEQGRGWTNTTFSYNASVNGTVFFNPSKTFIGTFYGSFSTPMVDGGFKTNTSYSVGAGLAYTLGKFRLSANLNNILVSENRNTATVEGNTITAVNGEMRNILNFGLTYTFGAPIQTKQERQNAKEVRSRM